MKLLTATREGQGEREGDFCHALEGELVMMGWVCATDQNDPLGGCGCGRAFSGLSSRRATTTAVVRDLDLTSADVELAVAAQFDADGFSPEVMGDLEYAYLFVDTVGDMIKFGAVWPVGTVVRRLLDSVHLP
ncbi:MAG: hypothetical protein JWP40_731 [Blastococcus sp.]|nr:hypothetical protein [Blastococcus sp.]